MTHISTTKTTGTKSTGRSRLGNIFHTFVRDRRCAQCWGKVEIEEVDGRDRIVCPNRCQPGGHVSAAYVEYAKAKDEDEARKVAEAYPDWDGAKDLLPADLTPEELIDSIQSLFGN